MCFFFKKKKEREKERNGSSSQHTCLQAASVALQEPCLPVHTQVALFGTEILHQLLMKDDLSSIINLLLAHEKFVGNQRRKQTQTSLK